LSLPEFVEGLLRIAGSLGGDGALGFRSEA
jgi:hypothetical protein